jgi:DNA-binding CsgD family transcriptional regulator
MAGKKQIELTEGQKQCLRLVDKLYTSKEIARELGISHFTVDQRLDGARRKLKTDTRKNAAKLFAAMEAITLSESLVYEADSIAPAENSGKSMASNNDERGYSNHSNVPAEAAFANPTAHIAYGWLSTLPRLGGSGHDLTKIEVFSAIVKTAMFSTVCISALTMTIIGLMRILA